MKQARFQSIMILIGVAVMATLIAGVCIYAQRSAAPLPQEQQQQPPQEGDSNKVCMTAAQFERLHEKKREVVVEHRVEMDRDRRVLSDPLYPPLNRTDRSTYEGLRKMLPVSTRPEFDTYRLLGYLRSTSSSPEPDTGGNTWKLFGRMKDRNQGDFYISPANNQDDIKIPLTPEVVKGERVRDVYTLPSQLSFNSPLLHGTPYVFAELPKSDLPSSYM
jgi:hypothetical protein